MIPENCNKSSQWTQTQCTRLYLPVNTPDWAPRVLHNPIWRVVFFSAVTHCQDCMIHFVCCVLALGAKQTHADAFRSIAYISFVSWVGHYPPSTYFLLSMQRCGVWLFLWIFLGQFRIMKQTNRSWTKWSKSKHFKNWFICFQFQNITAKMSQSRLIIERTESWVKWSTSTHDCKHHNKWAIRPSQ